jgi:iron complex transport system substrate-binding protein
MKPSVTIRRGFGRLPLALLIAAALALPALAATPGYPLTITDASGYSLTLADKPKAIVSLTLATDELLVDLVEKSRLAGIDIYATDPGISNVAEFAKDFPVKLTGEKEKIIALQPDLVLVADWKEKEFVQALRDAKIPVFVFKSPNDFDELKTAISQITRLVGEPAKGKAMQDKVDARLAAVATKTKGIAADKRPTVLAWTFYGSTYAKGTSFDALAEKAGLVNAATKAGLTGWPQLSKEQILALDPDIITMPSWSYDGKTSADKYLADFVGDPVFAGLKAVRNKRVIIMQDKHMQATSQYMASGVEDLARAAYPALFK